MTLHIGIVGCSAEGAALCYRTICSEGAALLGPHAHPEISMHTPSLAQYVHCLEDGDQQGIADLMLASARKLAAAGADFLVCPDNTIHQALHLVEPLSPLPWLHMPRIVAQEARARGFRRVGLTGTTWLVRSEVYPDELRRAGVEYLRPGEAECEEVGRIIMDELVPGRIVPASVARFEQVVMNLKERGCDAVVLGCTELPLIMGDANAPVPTLDSTRLLARAALSHAVSHLAHPSRQE
uniref:aspartate/glutamate racemase family protein n=1 Tax=Ramlibacter sp. TaxID=1917967 RepID=UPI002FCAA70F